MKGLSILKQCDLRGVKYTKCKEFFTFEKDGIIIKTSIFDNFNEIKRKLKPLIEIF